LLEKVYQGWYEHFGTEMSFMRQGVNLYGGMLHLFALRLQ
jgi:hypothetical protein